ncbi:hypothetical protein [Streptomyces sp. NPDC097619]|uniref:hypothetical protein n=1 Tax=Streptomyces sp. NPDC097619 TaxID=3157228 RepID=UPI00331E2FFB
MIATDQVRGPARRARLGRLTALRARRRGRRDAAALRPLLPEGPGGRREGAPPFPEIVTPFVMETRTDALRAAGQLRARMLREERRAITALHAESVRVVTQYDLRGDPLPAALARYGRMVGAWRTRAEVCRAHAWALTQEANQRLACYWDAVWRTVQEDRARELREAARRARTGRHAAGPAPAPAPPGPAAAGTAGRAGHPGYPGPAGPTGPTAPPGVGAHPGGDPGPAPRPAHWLPGRVVLGTDWDDVDAWLLRGPTPGRAPSAPLRQPALVRALEILDTQNGHAPPGGPGTGAHRSPGTGGPVR